MSDFGVPNVRAENVYRWRNSDKHDIQIWAEDGVVLYENQVTGDFRSLPLSRVKDAMRVVHKIAKSYVKQAVGVSGQEAAWQRSEQEHMMGLVKALSRAYEDALKQGDPLDPEVVLAKVSEHRRTLKNNTRMTPGYINSLPANKSGLIVP